jgi:hypothetical protein
MKEPQMKLRLKDKELPPTQLRLVLPAQIKAKLDEYVRYVRDALGREVEAREIAVEMLAQFMESDREFRQRQKREHQPDLKQQQRRSQSVNQANGHAAE